MTGLTSLFEGKEYFVRKGEVPSGGKAGGALRVAMLGLFAMGLAADAYATDPLLRRTPGSWLYGPETVWTDGNAGSGYLFHPLSEAMGTAGWRHPGLKATRIARLEAASRSVRVFFDL